MATNFEVKVKYIERDQTTGKEKKVNLPFLVDAVSFTDAEKRMHQELEKSISGDFFINAIKIANYSEIVKNEAGDHWFKCKVVYIAIDEEKGKEKKTSSYYLVEADNVEHANSVLLKYMEGTVSDFEIPSISETKIQDVFDYVMSESDAAEKYLKDEISTDEMIESLDK